MATYHLLYSNEYCINDKIKIVIPTVGEVLENEDEYYSIVSAMTAMPIDYMVMLDEAGIDYTSITEYDLFLMLFQIVQTQDAHLVFGDLDLTKFELMVNTKTKMPVMHDKENDITIDWAIHDQIAAVLRKIHHLEKNIHNPGNKEGRDFILERAKIKAKRNKGRQQESQLESFIVALVNTEQCSYTFSNIKDMTIYQFNESLQQIIYKINYDHNMLGMYTGNIRQESIPLKDRNWLNRE